MKTIGMAAGLVLAASATAMAQTAVGIGVSKSDAAAASSSKATAIGGGNASAVGIGAGGGGGNSAVTIATNPAVTSATINNTGTSTVRNVPSVFAPGLAAAGLETCLGSVSGGGSFVGTGLTFGTSVPDPGCAARLDARTLWSMGLRKAAVARLCLNPDIARSMPEVCGAYVPVAYQGAVYPAPLPPPLPGTFASAEPARADGAILLVDGKTGRERYCTIYLNAAQKCQVWADAKPAVRIAAAHKNAPRATPARLKADPPPVSAPKTVEVTTP